jgi:hypothetical protein
MLQTVYLSYGGKIPQGAQVVSLDAVVDIPEPHKCKILAVLRWPWVEVQIQGFPQSSFVERMDLRHITALVQLPAFVEVEL